MTPYLVVPLRRLFTPFFFCRFLLGGTCPALLTERHVREGWIGTDIAKSLRTVFCTPLMNACAQRDNLAPDGCTQYFFGSTTDLVKTYNFDGGQHLASQDQNICVR